MDGDGIDEDLTRAVSVAMLAAARAGEQVARMTQAATQERKARAAGNTAEAQRQVDAHTEAAKAYFEVVTRPEYLSVATDEQISEVARQADVWRERLPEAQRAAEGTSRELQDRRPVRTDEWAAVLAAEGEAADRQARMNGNQQEKSAPRDRDREAVVSDGTASGAVVTASVAQARPAREAPAAGRTRSAGRGKRPAVRPGPRTGVER